MVDAIALAQDATRLIEANGDKISIQFYTASYSGADYDDSFLSKSGTLLWISGLVQPLNMGNFAKWIEQGTIELDDKQLYLAGSISLSGGAVKIGVGSPTIVQHSMIPGFTGQYPLAGVNVYTKTILRILNNGSFFNEI